MEVLGLTVPLWLVLILAVLALYTYMMSRHHGTFKRLHIRGPAPWPVIGSLLELNKKGIHDFENDCVKTYGKICGYYGGMSPQTLIVADKNMLRKILVKEFSNFPDKVTLNGINGDLESSVINLKGDHWRHVRNKITPAFSVGKLRKMVPLVNHASDTLVESLRRKVKKADGVTDLLEAFGAYSLDVICSTAFGIQVDSQNNPNDEFIVHAKKFLNLDFFSPVFLILMFLPSLCWLMPYIGWSMIDNDVQLFFRQVTTRLLKERIVGDKKNVDFLQLMKNVQQNHEDSDEDDDEDKHNESTSRNKAYTSWSGKGITFDEILGNAEIFFFAGYETTKTALCMTCYYLALYPDYQDKLRQELSDVIGSNSLTYENLRQVKYLTMITNESMRINPPFGRTTRVCVRDTVIDGVKIPAGMHISIPIYNIHLDPDNWEDPEKFIPERFADMDAIDPMTFLPFGYGPRNCIGIRLAEMELKMALAKVVRSFQISVCSDTKIPPDLKKLGMMTPTSSYLKMTEIK